MVNTTTMSGAQEYAVQVMTDFFGRRPLEQMRNAFRNADVDGSGELDQIEFRKAIKSMNCGLTDKDADTLFDLSDNDGSGTLGINEFFLNFRHDHWPRERFFWTKPEPQVNLAANLTKQQRTELAGTLEVQFDQPISLSVPEVMKVLAEKVAVHGSAEKVFRVIDTNNNGTIDLDEIPEAIRPYELHVDDERAAEVLKEINRIAGKPAEEPLTYNSFALAFNPTAGPPSMGSIAFQAPPTNKHVREREPPDGFEYPVRLALCLSRPRLCLSRPRLCQALGPERSLESLHNSSRGSLGERATSDHMRSLSTLPATAPLDHSATTQTLRGLRADQERNSFDKMAGWRGEGEDAIDGGGDMLGKEIMRTGRNIDWHANHQAAPRQSIFTSGSASAPNLLAASSSRDLTPLEMGARGAAPSAAAPETPAAPAADAPPTPMTSASPTLPSYAQPTKSSAKQQQSQSQTGLGMPGFPSQPSLSSLSASMTNSSMTRTRSRLSLALESAGSRSSFECLYPGAASHHHVHEMDRLAHTSSIAALNSISSAVGLGSKINYQQRADRDKRETRLRKLGARQQERQQLLSQMVLNGERSVADLDATRTTKLSEYKRRIGHHQLIQLTRGMENGKAPILLEPSPLPSWVPVPPHLSSHWATISGHHADPPPRESAMKQRAAGGRRSFPEKEARLQSPPGPHWGGSHAQL